MTSTQPLGATPRSRHVLWFTVAAAAVASVLMVGIFFERAEAGSWADNKPAFLQQREAALLARLATLPKSVTHLGLSGTPLLPEPAWAAAIAEVPAEARVDGPPILRAAASVWRDGSISEHGAVLWDPYFVWTASGTPTDAVQPVIGTYVENATSPDVAAGADAAYPCPRDIGVLSITAILGSVVSFASTDGVSGTFNLASHEWSFS